MSATQALAIDRVLAVLGQLAPIEWSRLIPGVAQSHRLDYPPLIVWRFSTDPAGKRETTMLEQRLSELVRGFHGRVTWSIVKPGRNIVLTTKKVLDLEEGGNFESDAGVVSHLAKLDPMHGNNAHQDLADIVELLERSNLA